MIISPIYIKLPRKRTADKRLLLDLNWLMRAHRQRQHEANMVYRATIKDQVESIIQLTWPIKLRCRYFLRNDADVGNIHSVLEKFFLDSLVALHRLPDDGLKYVIGANYEFAGFDQKNPRCEIEIMEGYSRE